jgi:hypothetical protein
MAAFLHRERESPPEFGGLGYRRPSGAASTNCPRHACPVGPMVVQEPEEVGDRLRAVTIQKPETQWGVPVAVCFPAKQPESGQGVQ